MAAATGIKGVLRNPKARIAALAVLAVGGLYLLLRGRQPNATAGLPVQPTPTQDPNAVPGPIDFTPLPPSSGGLETFPTVTGGDLFPDNKLREASMALIDQIRGLSDQLAVDPGFASDGGGAGDPTGTPKTGGDGSPRAPGNALALANARVPAFARASRGARVGDYRFAELGSARAQAAGTYAAAHPAVRRAFGVRATITTTPGRSPAGAPQAPHANVVVGGRIFQPLGAHGLQPAPTAPKSVFPLMGAPLGRATSQPRVTPSGAFVVTRPTPLVVSTPGRPAPAALRAQPWNITPAPALPSSARRARLGRAI